MKVLYVTRKYRPSVGGMQQINTDLVASLRGKADVDLIALGRGQRHLAWFLPYALLRGAWRRCDVIHLGDGLLAPLGWLLSAIRRRPYTLTLCGLEITYRNRLYRSVVLPFIRKADRIVCISHSTLKLALANGCDAARCIVIPCGVRAECLERASREAARARLVERFGVPPGDLILLSVGRLVRR
ncbi:MAG TPA: glycosyltransferase, partial [Candidatus Deferrimicrobiaceae bacterium]